LRRWYCTAMRESRRPPSLRHVPPLTERSAGEFLLFCVLYGVFWCMGRGRKEGRQLCALGRRMLRKEEKANFIGILEN
ncbi:hypothetical protein, partial [Palleniella intestinalis]|uniref:hypothetical protein n=1 Tax=Palleniella intestinalis TaxID=2736291 RepID=UPI001C12EEB4